MRIAVIIPCFRVKKQIFGVLNNIPKFIDSIYVVDDGCPDFSGKWVQQQSSDSRVRVLFHSSNQGVGAAVVTGYLEALKDGAEILVKVDGDGQMDPRLIPRFIAPIVQGDADYTKGNRFYSLDFLSKMSWIRILGNSGLSFLNKVMSGYWNIMDPTNGFTAIHSEIFKLIPHTKCDPSYFFESDLLFRLSTVRAVVQDVPMEAVYGDEESHLKVGHALITFPPKYLLRTLKRLFYSYFLRDFNVGSMHALTGFALMLAGSSFGIYHWIDSGLRHLPTPSGTVMVSALPVILGFQLLLSAINYDITNIPDQCVHPTLGQHFSDSIL